MSRVGYIKIHRQMLSWEWYTDINTKVLFLHLLLKARFEDTKYKGKTVERGSLATTIPRLSDETKLTIKEVRTALQHLKDTKEVEIKATNRESIIKVLNYNVYQGCENEEGQTRGRQGAVQRQAKGERTEKESKEGKESKNKKDTKVSKKEMSDICLTEEWIGFTQMRKQIKKPLTTRAIVLALNKLDQLAPNNLETQKAILDQSTVHCWQGLFELKGDSNARSNQQPNSKDARRSESLSSKADSPKLGIVL